MKTTWMTTGYRPNFKPAANPVLKTRATLGIQFAARTHHIQPSTPPSQHKQSLAKHLNVKNAAIGTLSLGGGFLAKALCDPALLEALHIAPAAVGTMVTLALAGGLYSYLVERK